MIVGPGLRPTLFQIVTTGPDLAFIVFGRSHSREQVLQIYQIVFQVSFEFFLHTPGKKYSLAYYKKNERDATTNQAKFPSKTYKWTNR